MTTINSDQVKELRKRTGMGMMKCKKALEESDGDIEGAVKVLRKSDSKIADKKSDRAALEGIIGYYVHNNGKVGVLVELNCESDFVAKNEEFKELAHDLAMHIAASDPRYIEFGEIEKKVIEEEIEKFKDQFKEEGKQEEILDKISKEKAKKYFSDLCLVSQPFVKDPTKTIGDLLVEKISKLGENIKVKRFVRYEL